MMTDKEKDPEAIAIVAKLKRKARSASAYDGDDEDQGDDEDTEEMDASKEAKRSALEDIFQILKGRAPSRDEGDRFEEALEAYNEACGR